MNAKQPGWILHVDLKKIKPTSLGGYKYTLIIIIIIIDRFSSCHWVIFLKGKQEAAEKPISFITALRNSMVSYPSYDGCDLGSELFRFIKWVEIKEQLLNPPNWKCCDPVISSAVSARQGINMFVIS